MITLNIRSLSYTPICAMVLLLLPGAPSTVRAQIPAGVFVRDSLAGDNIEKVVSDALPKVKNVLAKIFKGEAKSRLRQVVVAAAWQKLSFDGDSLHLETSEFSGVRALTAPLNGTPVRWTRIWSNGKKEQLRVHVMRDGDALTVRYIAEDGERNDTYRFNAAAGILTHNITLKSGRLSAPIHYQLIYKR